MRRLILAVVLILLALPAAAMADPVADFELLIPDDCFGGSCVVQLAYDSELIELPALAEVDWDNRGPFVAGASLRCLPLTGTCGFRSPVYAAGMHTIVLQVTDELGRIASTRQVLRVAERVTGRPEVTAPDVSEPEDMVSRICAGERSGESCVDGRGRKTPGGGEKVSHKGWPAVTGVLWRVLEEGRGAHTLTGGDRNDELLGHHGSDRITGGPGKDILWGDWDPKRNNTIQRDVLNGGAGNDFIYPSHGTTRVSAGPGNDYIWAFYGGGVIDCGPGNDRVRVRLETKFKLRNCETVGHFCAFGADGHGGCYKPGENPNRKTR
jgi:hypothetical protein